MESLTTGYNDVFERISYTKTSSRDPDTSDLSSPNGRLVRREGLHERDFELLEQQVQMLTGALEAKECEVRRLEEAHHLLRASLEGEEVMSREKDARASGAMHRQRELEDEVRRLRSEVEGAWSARVKDADRHTSLLVKVEEMKCTEEKANLLEGENRRLASAVDDTTTEVSRLQQQVEHLTHRLEKEGSVLREAERRSGALYSKEREVTRLEQQVASLTNAVREKEAARRESEVLVATLTERMRDLEIELDRLRDELSRSGRQGDIDELRVHLHHREEQLRAMEEKSALDAAERDRLLAIQAELAAQQARGRDTNVEIARLQQALLDSEGRGNEYRKESDALRTQLEENNRELAKLTAALQAGERDGARWTTQVETLTTSLREHEMLRRDVDADRAEAAQRLKAAEAEARRLRGELSAQQTEMGNREEHLRRAHEKISSLEETGQKQLQQLQEIQAELRRLNDLVSRQPTPTGDKDEARRLREELNSKMERIRTLEQNAANGSAEAERALGDSANLRDEINRLNARLERDEEKWQKAQRAAGALEAKEEEAARLMQQIENLTDSLRREEEVRRAKEFEVNGIRDKMRGHDAEMDRLQRQLTHAEQALVSKDDLLKAAQADLRSAEDDAHRQRALAQQQATELATTQQALSTLKEKDGQLENQVHRLQQQLEAATAAARDAENRCANLERSLRDAETDARRLTDSLREEETRRRSAEGNETAALHRQRELETALERLRGDILQAEEQRASETASRDAQLRGAEGKIGQLEDTIRQQLQQLHECGLEVARLRQLVESTTETNERLQRHQDKLSDLFNREEAVSQKLGRLTGQLEAKERELANALHQVEQLTNALRAEETAHRDQQQTAATATQRLREAEGELDRLRAENHQARLNHTRELERLAANLQAKDDAVREAETRCAALDAAGKEKEDKLQALRQSHAQRIADKEAQAKKNEEEIRQLVAQLQTLMADAAHHQQAMRAAQTTSEQLQLQVERMADTLRDADQRDREAARLQGQVQSLQEELKRKAQENQQLEAALRELQQHASRWEASHQEAQAAAQQMKGDLQLLRETTAAEIERARADLGEREALLRERDEQLRRLDEECRRLDIAATANQSKADRHREGQQMAEDNHHRAQQQLEKLLQRLQEQEDACRATERRCGQLEGQERDIARMEQQVATLSGALRVEEGNVREKEALLAAAAQRRGELEEELRLARHELDQWRRSQKDIMGSHDAALRELIEKQAVFHEERLQLGYQAEAEVERWRTELQQTRVAHSQEVERLTADILAREERMKMADGRMRKAEEDFRRLSTERKEWELKWQQARERADRAEQKLQDETQHRQRVTTTLETKETELLRLMERTELLSTEIREVEGGRREKDAAMHRMNQRVRELESLVERLHSDYEHSREAHGVAVAHHEEQCRMAESKVRELEEALRREKAGLQELVASHDAAQHSLHTATMTAEHLQRRVDELTARLESEEERARHAARVAGQLEATEGEVSRLECQVRQLMSQLREEEAARREKEVAIAVITQRHPDLEREVDQIRREVRCRDTFHEPSLSPRHRLLSLPAATTGSRISSRMSVHRVAARSRSASPTALVRHSPPPSPSSLQLDRL